jgi:hypothetical protein
MQMKKYLFVMAMLLAFSPVGSSQTIWDSVGVDLSPYWNIDGWMVNDDLDVPEAYCLDSGSPGGQRVRQETLPAGILGGQLNWTEDRSVQFLLPDFQENALDAYLPDGSIIDVPNGKYERVFMALMSGNGAWPGKETDWAATETDERYEVNAFKPIYTDGEGEYIPIGTVNDWFWTPPEWVAPVSGNPDEIIVDFIAHADDFDYYWYWWDGIGDELHDYSQTTRVSGPEEYVTFMIETNGITSASLFITMWGNAHVEISTDDANYQTVYDILEDKGEPYFGRTGNMDGYEPNRDIYEFDLTPFLGDAPAAIYLKFSDAAPDLMAVDETKHIEGVDSWGPIIHQMGIFTGEVKRTRLGERLWPGLIREGNDAPQGGLILIKKSYLLDSERTLDKIQMPDNFSDENPRSDPYLTLFAMTLANQKDVTEVRDFMLY